MKRIRIKPMMPAFCVSVLWRSNNTFHYLPLTLNPLPDVGTGLPSAHTQTQMASKGSWPQILMCSVAPWWECVCGYDSLWRVQAGDSGGEMPCRGQMCVKASECACVTFGNTVLLIPHLGLSLGLQQDYRSRPIITWEAEGEVQCQTSDQRPKCDVTSMQ